MRLRRVCGIRGCAGKALALKPVNLSFEEAATLPTAGCTALQGLQKGGIRRGQRVLVNGASGGVGTFAVQIAKTFGTDVTAVWSVGATRGPHGAGRLGIRRAAAHRHQGSQDGCHRE